MKKSALALLALCLLFALAACGPQPAPSADTLGTAVAATLAALEQAPPTQPPPSTPLPTATVSEASPAPPTETPASPTPLSDAEAIKLAVNAFIPSPVDPATITVDKIQGGLAYGGVPGAYFIAAKDGDEWIVIHAGQTNPPCNAINPYDFPVDWVPECLAEDGSLVDRTISGEIGFQSLGAPTWSDPMDSQGRWYLVTTEGVTFKMENGALVMTAHEAGGYDEWGLGAVGDQTDFALEVTFKTGPACSGLDRYGVIFRAPDPSRGYVYEFSCDGRFRLYLWDGEAYTGVQNWKTSAAIVGGASKANRMGLIVKGDQVELYANDQLLGEYEITEYDSGRFGLVVGAKDTANFEARVDSVRFWNLAGS